MIIKSIQEAPESRRDWLLASIPDTMLVLTKTTVCTNFGNRDNHPIELYSPDFIYQRLVYIHQNPVRAGWVEAAEQYQHSSAL
jgi:hypothetical protein